VPFDAEGVVPSPGGSESGDTVGDAFLGGIRHCE
jgi:hypothetical protein